MKRRYAVAAVAAITLGSVLAAPLAAQADPFPPSGDFVIGDAQWRIDQYGIAYGWDAANIYDATGYLYYPGYSYDYGPGSNYFFCSNPAANAVVTYEANGDVTVDCATEAAAGTGLNNTYQIRFYAGGPTGYLARQVLTLDNPGDTDISLENLRSFWEPEYTLLGADPYFVTDSGQTTTPLPTDAWFIASSTTGASVAWTSAWAKPGGTAAAGFEVDFVSDDIYLNSPGVTVPAHSTVRLIWFTNMVIPATQDAPGSAAAISAATAQAPEFATFCGRLVEGLVPDAEYLGWGVPADCTPVLPATGPAIDLGVSGFALLLIVGGVVLVVIRRRSARVWTRS